MSSLSILFLPRSHSYFCNSNEPRTSFFDRLLQKNTKNQAKSLFISIKTNTFVSLYTNNGAMIYTNVCTFVYTNTITEINKYGKCSRKIGRFSECS